MPLSKTHYFHNIARKYIVAFYQLMSGYSIKRYNDKGQVMQEIPVAVTYAGKTKLFYYLQRNEETRSANMVLPRIGFIITDMVYDSTRRINPINEQTVVADSGDIVTFNHSGAPYNITVACSVFAKNMDDLLQIVEQIVPKFTPDAAINIKEIPEFDISRDVSVNLNSVNFAIESEFGEEDGRILIADMDFTIKGMFYRPITDAKVIKTVEMQLQPNNEEPVIETIEDLEQEP